MSPDEQFDEDLHSFLKQSYAVSDAELALRVKAAPDMGGATLVGLAEFMVTDENSGEENNGKIAV